MHHASANTGPVTKKNPQISYHKKRKKTPNKPRDQTNVCAGGEAKEEKRCQACVEKNGIRNKDQGPSKEAEVSVEAKKSTRTNDVAVSTSGRPATEDIGTETKREDKESEVRERDKVSKSKSGHARTHAIVINLDDKTRFSEEVTV